MANCSELKKIARARLRSAALLMRGKDWDGAAYMLGYVLECALKSAACKALRLEEYPERTRNDKANAFFMTHNFDQLLIVSGMSDIFHLQNEPQAFENWSEFTQNFQGDKWPAMRYDITHQAKFDEKRVIQLYGNLAAKPHGILQLMTARRRW